MPAAAAQPVWGTGDVSVGRFLQLQKKVYDDGQFTLHVHSVHFVWIRIQFILLNMSFAVAAAHSPFKQVISAKNEEFDDEV
jgi:hypothetical protein